MSLSSKQNFRMPILNETDQALLGSCMDEIRDVVGEISERLLVETIMKHRFDCTKALDDILNSTSPSATTSTAAAEHNEPMETGKYHRRKRFSLLTLIWLRFNRFSFNIFFCISHRFYFCLVFSSSSN